MNTQLQLPKFFIQDLFKSNYVQEDSTVTKSNFDLKKDSDNDSKQKNLNKNIYFSLKSYKTMSADDSRDESKKTILISNNDLNNNKVNSQSNNSISSNENNYPAKDVFYKNYVFNNKNIFNFLVDNRFDKVRSLSNLEKQTLSIAINENLERTKIEKLDDSMEENCWTNLKEKTILLTFPESSKSSTQITIYHENNIQQEASINLKKIFSISPIVNALIFCNKMVKKCVATSVENIMKKFQIFYNKSSRPLTNEELSTLALMIQCENNKKIEILSDKLTTLINKIEQIETSKVKNDTQLLNLNNDVNSLTVNNNKLFDSIRNDIKVLKEVIEKINSTRAVSGKSISITAPPPPPPPPLPKSPNKLNIPNTKTISINKKNNCSKVIEIHRKPLVSAEQLKNIKLKPVSLRS